MLFRSFTEAEGLSIGRLINNAGVGLFGEHLSLDVGAANARSPKSSKSSKSEGANKRGRRLVVGYVSPDMYTHSVSYFAHAPLSAHDPSRVAVVEPEPRRARLAAGRSGPLGLPGS